MLRRVVRKLRNITPLYHLKRRQLSHRKTLAVKSRMPLSLLIWGVNDFSLAFAQMLHDAGLEIHGLVTDDDALPCVSPFPVLSPEEVYANGELVHLPLVIAIPRPFSFTRNGLLLTGTNRESQNEFRHMLEYLKRAHRFSNPLLHPSALAPYLRLPLENHTLIFGIQGSGNTILSHLLKELGRIAPKHFTAPHPTARSFANLAREYSQLIKSLMDDIARTTGCYDVAIAPHLVDSQVGICYFRAENRNNTRIEIYGFPAQPWLYHNEGVSHQIPDERQLSLLQDCGTKMIFTVRNPLDILISAMRKADISNGNSTHDDIDPARISCMAGFHSAFLKEAAKLFTTRVHYEELLANPVSTIQELASRYEYSLTPKKAAAIWKKYGMKPLPYSPPSHFNKPGTGKGRKQLSEIHLGAIKLFDYAGLMKGLGYEKDAALFENIEVSQPDLTQLHQNFPQLSEAGELLISAHPDAPTGQLQKLLNDDLVQTLVRAGSLHSSHAKTQEALNYLNVKRAA